MSDPLDETVNRTRTSRLGNSAYDGQNLNQTELRVDDSFFRSQNNSLRTPVRLGQIVHYRLSAKDAETVNQTRTSHVGNSAYAGEVVPLLITKVDPAIDAKFEDDPAARPETISGQAFLDGNFHHLWIQRVTVGEEFGTYAENWSGPEVVEVQTQEEARYEEGLDQSNEKYNFSQPNPLVPFNVTTNEAINRDHASLRLGQSATEDNSVEITALPSNKTNL
jgi:hypothetical protein